MKTAYKLLRTGLKSDYDKSEWEIGKWREEKREIRKCVGLNASKNIVDALTFVRGEIIAKVEYDGNIIDSGDKITCSKMRIIKYWVVDKLFFVDVAIYIAEQLIDIFEKKYPGDIRPRKSIEAAKKYLNKPTEKNRKAASATLCRRSRRFRRLMRRFRRLMPPPYAAASAATYASYAAIDATDAATLKLKNKIHRYILKKLKTMEEVKK